jgi:hypothetical protein
MARCSPLGNVVAGMTKVVVVAELEHVLRDNPAASSGEKCPTSPGVEGTLSKGGSDNENSRTYYFGSSTITIDKIKETVEKGYFLEDEAHTPGSETVPDSDNDEAVVYEDFLLLLACPCLCI